MGVRRNRERWQVMWIDDNNKPKLESMEPGVCPCKHCWCSESVEMVDHMNSKLRVINQLWKSFEPHFKAALSSLDHQNEMRFDSGAGRTSSKSPQVPAETTEVISNVDSLQMQGPNSQGSERQRGGQNFSEGHREEEPEATPSTHGTSTISAEIAAEPDDEMDIVIWTSFGAQQVPGANTSGPSSYASGEVEIELDEDSSRLNSTLTKRRKSAKRSRKQGKKSERASNEHENNLSPETDVSTTSIDFERNEGTTAAVPLSPVKPPVEPHPIGQTFKCPQCPKIFGNAKNMESHKRTHTAESPFKCDECPGTFATAGILNSHKTTHSGLPPFKCGVCEATFVDAKQLKLHRRAAHSVEKPYKCNQCLLAFLLPHSLDAHKKLHLTLDSELDTAQVTIVEPKTSKNTLESNSSCQSPPPEGAAQTNSLCLFLPAAEGVKSRATGHEEDFKLQQKQFRQSFYDSKAGPSSTSTTELDRTSIQRHQNEVGPTNSDEPATAGLGGCHQYLTLEGHQVKLEPEATPQFISTLAMYDETLLNVQDREETKYSALLSFGAQPVPPFVYKEGQTVAVVSTFNGNCSSPNCNLEMEPPESEGFLSSARLVSRSRARTPGKRARSTESLSTNISEDDHQFPDSSTTPTRIESERKRRKTVAAIESPARSSTVPNENDLTFQCPKCPEVFANKALLRTHRQTHSAESPFRCNDCPATFTKLRQLNQHKKMHPGNLPYKCTICEAFFQGRNELKRHKIDAHPNPVQEPYKCDKCSLTFVSLNVLERHKKVHVAKKYKCDGCQWRFSKQTYYKRHLEGNPGCKMASQYEGRTSVADVSFSAPAATSILNAETAISKTEVKWAWDRDLCSFISKTNL